MTTTVLVLVTALACSAGFNLEPRHPDVISDIYSSPRSGSSYFGYALAFWKQSIQGRVTTWLLVGAPRAMQKELMGERVRQPGVVYNCSLNLSQTPRCHEFPILSNAESKEQDLIWRNKEKNITARAWIGATIAVEDKLNGGIAVCAPRMKLWIMRNGRYIPGMCFYWQSEGKVVPLPSLSKVYPYRSEWVVENGFYTGLGQAGISAHFVQNSHTSQLLVGAPGINHFKGAVSVYERRPWEIGGLNSLHMPTATQVTYHDYLGYSVTSARLHSDGRVVYVAGAPRAKGADCYSGAVYIMEQPHWDNWKPVSTLEGQQMGEYFGACVVALDLESDGQDDLLVVGAPLYSHKSDSKESAAGDQGRIYVFINKGEGQMHLLHGTIMGSAVPEARFGSSLALVGDINKDGFSDLAVGAPYEDAGAIYIYHGREGGLRRHYSQRISGSEIHPKLSGFGISIASGVDVDGNSFNDLAIGSHESSNVTIIKSYPIIEFEASLEPNVKKLSINAVNFTVKACLRYFSKASPDQLLSIMAEVTVRADTTLRRVVLHTDGMSEDESYSQVHLHRDILYCWPLELKHQNNPYKVMKPIKLSMDYKILDDNSTNRARTFCKFCPMSDPLKPQSVHIKIPLGSDCKSIVCVPDLKVEARSSNDGKTLVLGKDSKITLNVNVSNTGETAYLPKITLMLSKQIMLIKLPKNCYQVKTKQSASNQEKMILCNLDNLLSATKNTTINKVTMDFELDISSITLHTSLLTFNLTASSSNEDQMPEDNNLILDVPVKLVVSQIHFTGKKMQTQMWISPTEEGNETGLVYRVHRYNVVNYGPSPVEAIHLRFKIPFAMIRRSRNDVLPFAIIPCPQVTIGGNPFTCDMDYSVNSASIDSGVSDNWTKCISIDDMKRFLPKQKSQHSHKIEDGAVVSGEVRRRRSTPMVWASNETDYGEYQMKQVLGLNCSEGEKKLTLCMEIDCKAGPLLPSDKGAEVNLELYFNKSVIGFLQNNVDLILMSTLGRVDIVDVEKYEMPEENRLKIARVDTIFLKGKVTPWIEYPLSIAVGLFVLLLMTKALSNVGFFKRGHKEKLQLMMEKVAEQEFDFGVIEDETNSAEIYNFDDY